MSQARLRMWLVSAIEGKLSPEIIQEVCDRFLRIAAGQAAGEYVYIPQHKPLDRQARIDALRGEGRSLREIADVLDVSHECVRQRCQHPTGES